MSRAQHCSTCSKDVLVRVFFFWFGGEVEIINFKLTQLAVSLNSNENFVPAQSLPIL